MRVVSGTQLGIAVLAAVAGVGCYGDSGAPSQSPLVLAKAPSKSGDQQTGPIGLALGNDLRVLVTRDGAPVNGVTVAWFTSEGSLNPPSSQTDPNGIATTSWTLGSTVGTKATSATVTGATGSPLAFTAQAVAPGQPGGVMIEVLGP